MGMDLEPVERMDEGRLDFGSDLSVRRDAREIEIAATMAQRFPRNPMAAADAIRQECTRVSLAQQALYEYHRGGSAVSGPSIRLAETMAQHWGHLDFGHRVLEQTARESLVEAYCWDMQTNVRRRIVFSVPHVRQTKGGQTDLTDPRDLYEVVANMASRRVRACILSVIPGDLAEQAVEVCNQTLIAEADITPEALKKMVGAFAEIEVSLEQIERRIGRHIEAVRPAQLVELRRIYTSIRDGISQASNWFDPLEVDSPAPKKRGKAAVRQAAAMVTAKEEQAKETEEAQ